METLSNLNYFFNIDKSITSYAFVFIYGLVIGSFLNVLIYRIPVVIYLDFLQSLLDNNIPLNEKFQEYYDKNKKVNISTSSKCPKCNSKIKAIYNIPVIGYLMLLGKCFNCRTNISMQYPIIELFNAIGYLFIYIYYGEINLANMILMTTFSIMITMSVIDYKEKLLPDVLVYPFMFLGLVYNVYIFKNTDYIIELIYMAVILYSFIYIYEKIRNIGFLIGNGDLKLLIGCTAWIGMLSTFHVLFIACIISLIILILRKEKALAFGPSILISFLSIFIYTNL